MYDLQASSSKRKSVLFKRNIKAIWTNSFKIRAKIEIKEHLSVRRTDEFAYVGHWFYLHMFVGNVFAWGVRGGGDWNQSDRSAVEPGSGIYIGTIVGVLLAGYSPLVIRPTSF